MEGAIFKCDVEFRYPNYDVEFVIGGECWVDLRHGQNDPVHRLIAL
jgi:hypothetical protein